MPRRRSAYHVEAEVTPSPPASNWLTALGHVPVTFVLTFIVTAAIFYGVTQYRLASYDTELVALKSWKDQMGPQLQTRLDQEAQQRTGVRNEFLANQARTTEILAKMDSRLAVSETKQEAANQTLNKIADELARLNAANRNGARR